MTVQIANELEELIKPIALAVIVRAKHLCMSWRGVCEHDTQMVTSVMRGSFRENEAARSEFLTLIQGMEY
jgi:GTP cyclohydrolase I